MVEAINHESVRRMSFNFPREVGAFRYTTETWESDVPYERVVFKDLEWKIDKDTPIAYFDIECDDSHGVPLALRDPILSIAMIVSDGREYYWHGDEKTMLMEFVQALETCGIGVTWGGGEYWDGRGFDVPYLAKRYDLVVAGVLPEEKRWLGFKFNHLTRHCKFYDLCEVYKNERAKVAAKAGKAPPSLHLGDVGEFEGFGGKIGKGGKKVYQLTPEELREYNMYDVTLTKKIDEKYSLMKLRIEKARIAHLPLLRWEKKGDGRKGDQLRPLIIVDQVILKYARSMGLVMPNIMREGEDVPFAGARVIEPKVGLYENIQIIDVMGMYPSIIRYEKVSVDKDRRLVPEALNDILAKKDKYDKMWKEAKKTKDPQELTNFLLRTNYKQLSNVFYGAFGNHNSRLYDPAQAGRITAKGRWLSEEMEKFVTGLGFRVMYGDTDSIFIEMSKDKVKSLVSLINKHVYPYEVENAEYFKTIAWTGIERGAKGNKKKYFGIDDKDIIHFVGMEKIKKDWAEVVKMSQEFFSANICYKTEVAKMERCKENLRQAVLAGRYDQFLPVTKGVKDIGEYKHRKRKDGTDAKMPIHVRAYQKLIEKGYPYVFDVTFVFVKDGDVEPVLPDQVLPANIDREKHWRTQVEPAIERVLTVLRPTPKKSKGIGVKRKPKRTKMFDDKMTQTKLFGSSYVSS